MAFLSPGDLCGIETKFMCIFSPLSLSFCTCLFVVVFGFFISLLCRDQAPFHPRIYMPPLLRIFPFAYSLVSIIISCFVAFSFCFCFAFDFNFSFFFLYFFGHFRSKFWPCFFRFCSVWCHALFSLNAALGNCVWNREWNGNGNESGNPSSSPRGYIKYAMCIFCFVCV